MHLTKEVGSAGKEKLPSKRERSSAEKKSVVFLGDGVFCFMRFGFTTKIR